MYPFTKFVYVMKTKEVHKFEVNTVSQHNNYIKFIEELISDHHSKNFKGKAYYSRVPNDLYWADQHTISYESLPDEVKAAFALCE